jgi:rhodanese-related sulfurtransferase
MRRAMMIPMSSASADSGASSITRDELIRLLRAGRIVLVDVLSPESFAAAHIPGAINLPVADIARRAPDVLRDRHADIVAYCGGPT